MLKFIKELINGKQIYVSKWANPSESGYVTLDFRETMMISAEQAFARMEKVKAAKILSNRNHIFTLIRLAMTNGALKTRVPVKYMMDHVTFFEGLGYTVIDVIPTNGQYANLLDENGEPTNIPYHYYEVSWEPVITTPITDDI